MLRFIGNKYDDTSRSVSSSALSMRAIISVM